MTPSTPIFKQPVEAGGAKFKLRHFIVLTSFFLSVVAPSSYAYFYLTNRAVPQYISISGFTVRKEEQSSAFDMLGSFSGITSDSTRDIDLIYKFIQSQEIVQDVVQILDFKSHYSENYNKDPLFSLKPGASIEQLVDYWNRVVKIYYDGNLGLIELQVHAFSPDFAVNVNELIIKKSTQLINSINAVSQEDSKQYARTELDQAITRLKDVRRKLRKFRAKNNIIDPGSGLQGELNVVNSLLQQLTSTQVELDVLKLSTSQSDPRLAELEDKIVIKFECKNVNTAT